MRIVAICGSLRKASANMGVVRAAKELAPEDVEFIIADISEIPMYNEDVRVAGPPAAVTKFRELVLSSDAILFGTPEFNYSMPGVLKNAIDWASRGPNVFDGKPCTMVSAGGGLGGMRAQLHLRQCCIFLNMPVLNKPELSMNLFNGSVSWDKETGDITDEKQRGRIKAQVEALVAWTKLFPKDWAAK